MNDIGKTLSPERKKFQTQNKKRTRTYPPSMIEPANEKQNHSLHSGCDFKMQSR